MEPERRRHPRSWPQEDMLAIMAPTPTLAKIKDLSRGGMRLEYLRGPSNHKLWTHVNIFLTSAKVFIPGVSFRLVYDRPETEDASSPPALRRWSCGVEFSDLSQLQTFQLDNILLHHSQELQDPVAH